MILYTLICDQGHEQDAWFQNAAAFDKQAKAGLLECAVCGSTKIQKSLMAPHVNSSKAKNKNTHQPDLRTQDKNTKAMAQAIKSLRQKIEQTADDVGDNFASEARKLYYSDNSNQNESDEQSRGIYGQATTHEMKELNKEGIPFLPIPSLPEEQN
ncbi:MAG: DUF1178 family protein [Pseudomonadota bacterium]